MNAPSNFVEPKVGIYWLVSDRDGGSRLLTDSTRLAEAEPYGDHLTHPRGHYEVWESWKSLNPAQRSGLSIPNAVLHGEYEAFPRGRVVYFVPSDTFTIYADRRLQKPRVVSEIKFCFGLESARVRVLSDEHYC